MLIPVSDTTRYNFQNSSKIFGFFSIHKKPITFKNCSFLINFQIKKIYNYCDFFFFQFRKSLLKPCVTGGIINAICSSFHLIIIPQCAKLANKGLRY